PPTLSVTSPTEGQSFAAGASINMAATATDSDGVARVDFYIDGVLKLSDTTAPYSYTATGVSSGSHVARVVAVDTKGAVTGINRNFTVQAVVTGTCKVVYTKQNDWGTGATINLDISNTGTTAVNNWTLAFNFSGTEKIRDFWNATITQSGQGVSIKPLSWNSTINPGQTVQVGFNIDYTGSASVPASFTLNGQTCTK
uniref:cellulose binding domain-containing protein n=1 Tax=Deinococcus misasensis TaxID=392413 RepID=UPI0005571906